MPLANGRDLRRHFLDYFAKHDHRRVPSSSLVPSNDPTLLFTNAGMVQFKDVFTGQETGPSRRATSAQKCVRSGGKHNDLENVGRTARHHTFFEMLGNFSFGDYFKADAIAWAWELLTRELGLDRSRLRFTVFGGDAALGLGPDDEARSLWKKVTGAADHEILALGAKDNFWAMGETGPCGPCSEIHWHQDEHLPCPMPVCLGPACDCDRWLEIWNLVFMQFNRATAGAELVPLPAPSVDTGMGLERLAAVLQGVMSNYETDLLQPIVARAEQALHVGFDPSDYSGTSVSLRAVADHARATAFLMADGVFPDKTGREYVLRRIMRRAVYHGWLQGCRAPFFNEVVDQVVESMHPDYPELLERRSLIRELALQEETRFIETLERGMRLLDEQLATSHGRLSGAAVFKLYDTYGFPVDLTELIAQTRGRGVDVLGFEEEMSRQRRRSTFGGSGEVAVADVYRRVQQQLRDQGAGETLFVGYDSLVAEAKVLSLVASGQSVPSVGPYSGVVGVVTGRTPFYGEQGGQVGDTGTLRTVASGGCPTTLRVVDTQKPVPELVVHLAEVAQGELRVGDTVALEVDGPRRAAVRGNHSATHLLHWALRAVLGDHVAQKGSLVAPERLRFDFSHFAPLSMEERRFVEDLVNSRIRLNESSTTEELGLAQAKAKGAMAFFGERYGERVRVVTLTDSVELCGGTHVRRTGDIGSFVILSESGVAQGVRRIEATTGDGVVAHLRQLEDDLLRTAAPLRAAPAELPERVERLLAELKQRQREVEKLRGARTGDTVELLLGQVEEHAGLQVLVARTEVGEPKALRELGDRLRDKLPRGVIVLGGLHDGKSSLLALRVASTELLGARAESLHAGKLVAEAAKVVGGRGGGRPDMAQAGGPLADQLDAALATARNLVLAAAVVAS
jgi:alanyl-tRNA synthetase